MAGSPVTRGPCRHSWVILGGVYIADSQNHCDQPTHCREQTSGSHVQVQRSRSYLRCQLPALRSLSAYTCIIGLVGTGRDSYGCIPTSHKQGMPTAFRLQPCSAAPGLSSRHVFVLKVPGLSSGIQPWDDWLTTVNGTTCNTDESCALTSDLRLRCYRSWPCLAIDTLARCNPCTPSLLGYFKDAPF